MKEQQNITPVNNTDFEQSISFFHDVLEEWLSDPSINLACGKWSNGAISEMPVNQEGILLPQVYDDCFSGVREIRLGNCGHHVHIDLAKVHSVIYVVEPSVCFEFRPSFELRFLILGPGNSNSNNWEFSIMISEPYGAQGLDTDTVERFFSRAWRHFRLHPKWCGIQIDRRVLSDPLSADMLTCLNKVLPKPVDKWEDAYQYFERSYGLPTNETEEPLIVPLLRDALKLKDASLVFFRDKLLVEFQTEKISGLYRYVEEGHVSWQIGKVNDHHCHLSLDSVATVLFSAEPTSCQQGRLNYTVWFLVSGDCGNPWKYNGYFSIVLNKPYSRGEPRVDIIRPIFELYKKYEHLSWVHANDVFMNSMEEFSCVSF